MSKRSFLAVVLFVSVFFFTGTAANAQCTILSFNSLKAVWQATTKEDKLKELGFEKRSGNNFVRCWEVMCTTNDSTSRSYNEWIFVYDDEVMYSFSDKNAYQKLKSEVKGKTKYVGFAMFEEIKREYYTDGKICYCFYIGERKCLSTIIPDYNAGLLEKIPSYVESE